MAHTSGQVRLSRSAQHRGGCRPLFRAHALARLFGVQDFGKRHFLWGWRSQQFLLEQIVDVPIEDQHMGYPCPLCPFQFGRAHHQWGRHAPLFECVEAARGPIACSGNWHRVGVEFHRQQVSHL